MSNRVRMTTLEDAEWYLHNLKYKVSRSKVTGSEQRQRIVSKWTLSATYSDGQRRHAVIEKAIGTGYMIIFKV